MKTKILFILLSVLFILPVDAMSHKSGQQKKTIRIHRKYIKAKTVNRSPLEFDLSADETDNNLIITFQSSLNEADIIVTDKNGNTVALEPQTSIYEGKTICIPNPNSYPYRIDITSQTLDYCGEITQEYY